MVSIKEKVSQLFISKNPDNINGIKKFIKEGIGGFTIGKGGEIINKEQLNLEGNTEKTLTNFIRKLKDINSKIPLFFAIDGEGGNYFNRLKNISDYKSPRYYGKKFEKDNDLEFFKKEVNKFAELMGRMGLNMNFAPLFDKAEKGYKGYIAEERAVIKTDLTESEIAGSNRSYSDKRETMNKLAIEAMKIFQKHKIIPTVKHFPSYGVLNVDQNPHIKLTKINMKKERLLEEIETFKKAVHEGCYAIMTGHIIISCLDKEKPATISEKVYDFIRKELGFNGLIVSDELNMNAIKDYYSGLKPEKKPEKAALDALITNDILLISHPETFIVMRNAILKKVETNTEIRKKIEESYKKIIKYKKIIGLL
ncbi:glycoside hydrolase family 3 protein [Candidatus Woesearchaeota archaeon]|nr:glycoside hydrolase family 3 protein [Candidatus Woesearchaeota archaeon]